MDIRKKIYEFLESQNSKSSFYDHFMLCCIILSIIPLFFKQTNAVFFWIDKITVSIFIIDYILRWLTADFKYGRKSVLSFLRYPFSFFAVIDLLSILPSFVMLNSGLKLFRLFRVAKALRTLKLLRYSKSFNMITEVIKREKKGLLAVSVLSGGYILISALVMFQVEIDRFDTFFDAFYWAVVTLTTVGYGDIYPLSDIGRVISMISSFMGIAIVALPTGIITAGYMNELNKQEQTKQAEKAQNEDFPAAPEPDNAEIA